MIHIGEPPRRHNPTGPAVEKEIPSTDHLGINTELLCMHKHDCHFGPDSHRDRNAARTNS
jgi:hypothetical protein